LREAVSARVPGVELGTEGSPADPRSPRTLLHSAASKGVRTKPTAENSNDLQSTRTRIGKNETRVRNFNVSRLAVESGRASDQLNSNLMLTLPIPELTEWNDLMP
jgi:hypothetical protein